MPRSLRFAMLASFFAITNFHAASADAWENSPNADENRSSADGRFSGDSVLNRLQDETKIAKLIKQLGDDDYGEREAAYQALLEIGEPAVDQLRTNLRAPDSEVRFRIKRLIRVIELTGYEKRLAKFLNGAASAESLGLSGWKRVSVTLGDTKKTRQFFVNCQKRFPDAMTAIEKTPQKIETIFNEMARIEIDNKRYTAGFKSEPVQEALIFMMVMSEAAESAKARTLSMNSRISNWLQDEGFHDLANSKNANAMLLRAVKRWLSNAKTYDSMTARRMNIAINIGAKDESWRFAKILLDNKSATSASFKYQAILFVRNNGDKSHLKMIEPLIDNNSRATSIYQPNARKSLEVKLCDIALDCLITLNKKDHKDFGMIKLDTSSYSSTSLLPQYGFEKDEQRKSAIKKWKESSNKTSKK